MVFYFKYININSFYYITFFKDIFNKNLFEKNIIYIMTENKI